jgi:hypothetical protein
MASKKRQTVEETNDEMIETVEETEVEVKPVKKAKVFKDEDTVVCRSITHAELTHEGRKSGSYYVWAGYGDTCEVEVRDINALRASHSNYLYAPKFVIEDEDFINQPRYAEVKAIYDKAVSEDINELLDLPLAQFKQALVSLPKGYRDSLVNEASTRILNDDFDSIKKIRIIDEICNTDLHSLIS